MNRFDYADFMAGYMGVGAYMFDASEVFKTIDIENYTDLPAGDGQLLNLELRIRRILFENFFLEQETIMHLDFISKNCYGNVEKWHSDAEYVMPGQNATVNCFFDDTGEEIGGRFDIIQYRDGILGTTNDVEGMASFYPKKFSVICFNQNRNWLHKAVGSKNQRRMVSMATRFFGFNEVYPNFVQC